MPAAISARSACVAFRVMTCPLDLTCIKASNVLGVCNEPTGEPIAVEVTAFL